MVLYLFKTTFFHHFQVIRTTGFMKGLYEENEMKSDSVKVGLFHLPSAPLLPQTAVSINVISYNGPLI